jgi:hypothetical protein
MFASHTVSDEWSIQVQVSGGLLPVSKGVLVNSQAEIHVYANSREAARPKLCATNFPATDLSGYAREAQELLEEFSNYALLEYKNTCTDGPTTELLVIHASENVRFRYQCPPTDTVPDKVVALQKSLFQFLEPGRCIQEQ